MHTTGYCHGFSRYVVYGRDGRELYVLGSTEVNNATYVLKKNWETASAMTKAQVLDDGAHHAHLVHRGTWWKAISDLMRTEDIPLLGAGRKPR